MKKQKLVLFLIFFAFLCMPAHALETHYIDRDDDEDERKSFLFKSSIAIGVSAIVIIFGCLIWKQIKPQNSSDGVNNNKSPYSDELNQACELLKSALVTSDKGEQLSSDQEKALIDVLDAILYAY